MFSVVMANYNGEAYLREAMESVISQEYEDFEFIVVDDCSTDGSGSIIRELADRHANRVRAIFCDENQGQGQAFNIGVAASKGDVVCFFDSDDVWLPGKLRNTAAFIAWFGPASLYQHNLFFLEKDERTEKRFRETLVSGDLFSVTQKTGEIPLFVPTSGLAFPRAILDKVLPIPPLFRTCADGYLTRTTFCYGPIASTYDAWGYYRVHGGNNVFQNPNHDTWHYRHKMLYPALNAYYEAHAIDLRFEARRARTVQPAKPAAAPASMQTPVRPKRSLAQKLIETSLLDLVRYVRRRLGRSV